MKYLTHSELGILKELRARFLAGKAGARDYWQSPEHLQLYDAFFAERIGWKWDAVIDELSRRRWRPQMTRVLDWGCGTGVAHRRVMAAWPQFTELALYDRSPRAKLFAAQRAQEQF